MDTDIITAILQRVKAHHEVEFAHMVIRQDGSWHINVCDNDCPEFETTVASGESFSEFPAYLSTLK